MQPGARRRRSWPARWPRSTDNLRALRPDLAWGRARAGPRRRSRSGYGEATGALEEIGELDDLLDQLGQEHPGATLDDVDVEAVERHARPRRRRRRTPAAGAGARTAPAGLGHPRRATGLTLSPKALRRLGGTALRRVFADLHGRPARASTTCATRARPAR